MSQPNKGNILIVDDTPANLQLLANLLSDHGYEPRPAPNGRLALAAARRFPPDIVLLDINMPDMNGFDVCRAFKQDAQLKEIPILFISALNATEDKLTAFDAGGVDYITKPFQFAEVLARVETHLKLARQQREIEQLRQQERDHYENLTQMKNDVLQTVSHDLRNPLTAITASLEMLHATNAINPEDEFAQRFMLLIERATKQMTTLITDVLDLARLDTGVALTPQLTDIDPFLRSIAHDFEPNAQQKNHTLTFNPLNHSCYVNIDQINMTRAIGNLLSNAIKYTPKGGQITLSLTTTPTHAQIHVQDNGLGIPTEDIPHLAQKFYRVNQESHMEQEGTGLGLAFVFTLVDKHNGHINIDSALGQGTTITVNLPLASLPA
ncbi:MAG TPA: hybrid sensor histidine kinase/response regulator [Anaerolineae bacterium]|nr:hybrid sensor histidine kinase/response regulator [Anaerolineae bacterium]